MTPHRSLERLAPLPSISADEIVIASWDVDTAVTAPVAPVAWHWSDFFYPSSDAAAVMPPHVEWILVWHHEEFFEFGCASSVLLDADRA
jgi:hypothetical protein